MTIVETTAVNMPWRDRWQLFRLRANLYNLMSFGTMLAGFMTDAGCRWLLHTRGWYGLTAGLFLVYGINLLVNRQTWLHLTYTVLVYASLVLPGAWLLSQLGFYFQVSPGTGFFLGGIALLLGLNTYRVSIKSTRRRVARVKQYQAKGCLSQPEAEQLEKDIVHASGYHYGSF